MRQLWISDLLGLTFFALCGPIFLFPNIGLKCSELNLYNLAGFAMKQPTWDQTFVKMYYILAVLWWYIFEFTIEAICGLTLKNCYLRSETGTPKKFADLW